MNKRKSTDMIIIHCSATPEGRDIKADTIRQWHLQRKFEDIGYHYVIDLDGTIEKGRDEDLVGSHCFGHNGTSIGICYVGGCDKYMSPKDTRTDEQIQAMTELLSVLMEKYGIPPQRIYGHNHFNPNKECPSFDVPTYIKEHI